MGESGFRRSILIPLGLESIAAGICCFFLAVIVGVMVRLATRGPLRRQSMTSDPAAVEQITTTFRPPPQPLDLLTVGILGPLLETLLFLLLYWALQRDRDLQLRTRTYILLMGALGWLLHGLPFQSINRILPFAIIAWLFARWAKRASVWHGFAAAAIAHCVWNLTLLLLYFARRALV